MNGDDRSPEDHYRGGERGVESWESEDSHRDTTWKPAPPSASLAPPCLKWKLFVRGKDSTLQGRGVCQEQEDSGEGCSYAPSVCGDATKIFYESVISQADGRTSEDVSTVEGMVTDEEIDFNIDRYRDRGTDRCRDIEHRPTHACLDRESDRHKERDAQEHRHRKTGTKRTRLRNADSSTSSQTPSHDNSTSSTRETDRQRDTEEHRHRQTGTKRTRERNTNSFSSSETHSYDITNSGYENATNNSTQHTPTEQDINTALRHAQNNDVTALSAMLDEGLGINTKDVYGWTLLMVAACGGALDTVRMLLKRGARTGFRDARGNTALYLATIKGHRDVTEILVKANKRRTRRMDETERDEDPIASETSVEDDYFCETCEVAVKERDRVTHSASIVHQFKTKTGPTRTQYGIPPTNRGYQLLLVQGWDTEDGLGAERQGLKFPVKTVLKRDRKGLGADGVETPRVTHFGPGDASAVKRPSGQGTARVERITTISKREMRHRKVKEREEERKLRRMLNEPDM